MDCIQGLAIGFIVIAMGTLIIIDAVTAKRFKGQHCHLNDGRLVFGVITVLIGILLSFVCGIT